jgi:hypothetical protein
MARQGYDLQRTRYDEKGWRATCGLTLSRTSFLFYDDPPKLSQEGIDVHCPPISCSAINYNRDSLPTSLATSSIKDPVMSA